MKLSIRAVAGALLLVTSFAATAQLLRMLPAETKKGELESVRDWKIVIDGKTLPLAPGVRIRDKNNMIVPPTQISGPAKIRYTFDPMGNVDKVWLLTAEEIALPEPTK